MAEEYFIVSLDFDGVLAHGYKAKIRYAKEWFGVDLSLAQTKESGFNALMRSLGKKVDYRSLMDPLNEQHISEYEMPVGCVDILSGLYAQGFRFVVITSRNDHDFPYAAQFIQEKFGDLIKYLHNTRNEPKGHFVSRLKPRVHVDDDLSKLLELVDYPVELVYFRQPENEGKEVGVGNKRRIWEAGSFADVEVILRRISALHKAVCLRENLENNWKNVARIFSIMHSLSETETEELLKRD